jgi:hypothetical protein
MHYTHEQHLHQIEGQVLELKEALWDKPDREDLEYGLRDIVSELVVSKLEEIHDEVRELQGGLEDIKSQVDDLADADWP